MPDFSVLPAAPAIVTGIGEMLEGIRKHKVIDSAPVALPSMTLVQSSLSTSLSPPNRMATVSKDGTWKLWDTDVEYKKQQDPYLLLTGKCQVLEPCRVALSPDARTLAVSSCTSIFVYGTLRGEEEERFENVHGEPITDLAFDVNNRFLVSCGDRAIRVFHNTVGYRAVVEEMKALLKKATNESTKQRLQQQINSAQSALTSIYRSKSN